MKALEKASRRDIREKSFEREVLERLTKIETKLDDYNSTKDKAEDAYTMASSNEKEINEIKDKMTWLSRTITATIIGIVIAAIVFAIKMM